MASKIPTAPPIAPLPINAEIKPSNPDFIIKMIESMNNNVPAEIFVIRTIQILLQCAFLLLYIILNEMINWSVFMSNINFIFDGIVRKSFGNTDGTF